MSHSFHGKTFIFFGVILMLAVTFLGYQGTMPGSELDVAASRSALGEMPLAFEPNVGQTAPEVDFISRGAGYSIFLTRSETVLSLKRPGEQGRRSILRLQLKNSDPKAVPEPSEPLSARSNYLKGADPSGWLTDVPNYRRVSFKAVYPGVDQVFYGKNGELEYDFVVAANADVGRIKLSLTGADDLRIDPKGDLRIKVNERDVIHQRPVAYQNTDTGKIDIPVEYSVKSDRDLPEIGFKVGEYDHSRPLVIDPVIAFSTYLGGNGADSGKGIAIDGNRNIYVTGNTLSTDFPTVNPVQPVNASPGSGDVFVTKINAAGTAIVYSTYVGGNIGDIGHGIDVDNAGNAYITGTTGGGTSDNFPVVNAFDSTFNGVDDAFLFKLNPAGNAFIYSTYLGGSDTDIGFEVKVNRSTGEAFVAGNSLSGASFPTTPGAFNTTCSNCVSGSFVTHFNSQGDALVYSTFIGPGPANDLAIDGSGAAFITGSTISTAFPITAGAAQPTCTGCSVGRSDAFVTKLDPSGSVLLYSTYLGGSIDEVGNSIAVDSAGDAYVTGRTESSAANTVPFPTTPGAFQSTSPGTPDAFVTKVNPTGTSFIYSTYLGGNVRDEGYGIAVDPAGNAHVTGRTLSANFPLVSPFQTGCTANGACVFIASLNSTGSGLLFSTLFGQGQGLEVVADGQGSIYVTGETVQGLSNLPTVNPIQPNPGGGNSVLDAFVAKIQVSALTAAPVSVGGRVLSRVSSGLRAARVALVDENGNTVCQTLTNSFGEYHIDNVTTGHAYVVTASLRGYFFDKQIVTVNDQVSGLDIVAR